MSPAKSFLAICTVLFCCHLSVSAQEVRAALTGVVYDPSGAPVAGAKVSATNVSQQVSISAESNVTGDYRLPHLVPGAYLLTVEAPGFKRFIRENIILRAQDVRRIDVTLELGEVVESVTVSEAVSQLETETATRSQVIANELIMELPTQGRNPWQLAWAAAGVVKTGSWRYLRTLDIAGTSNVSINGGRNRENEVLLDGISNVRSNRTVIHVPSMEAVQEFKVLANTYDAQYGRTGGGIVTIVTKGGGNSFHGRLYEYFQNDNLNANTTELNRGGKPKPPFHINDFGGYASGPVYIPRVVDGRNRLFWMLSYQVIEQRTADPRTATFPLMEWRNGDFSTLFNSKGNPVTIHDPLTTDAEGIRQPFPGNIIPKDRLNPIALKVMSFYPAPSWQGEGPAHVNNYITPGRWTGDLDEWIGRLDFNASANHRFFFRYGQNPWNEFRAYLYPGDSPAEPGGQLLIRNGRNLTFDWSWVVNPRATFNLRAGLNRWEEPTGSSYRRPYNPADLGFDPNLVSQFTRLQFPRFDLGTYSAIGPSRGERYVTDDVYSLQPNAGVMVRRHYIKFGFEARQYKDNDVNTGLASGRYGFTKNWTQRNATRADATSGNELATFLLGYPSSASVDRNMSPTFLHRYWALFLNDDWKLTPRLSLNLGLRWDYEEPNLERFDRIVRGFDFNAPSPIAGQVQGLNLKGAVLFAGVGGQPRYVFQPDKNNIQPRVGLAYRIGDHWVIRGGYGLYYLGHDLNGSTQGFSRTTSAVVSTDGGLTPAVSLFNAFANLPGGKLLEPIGNKLGAASFLGEAPPAYFFDAPRPYSHQFSFDIQRQLPLQLLFEVGYSGNLTRRLPISTAVNVLPAPELGRRKPDGSIDTAYYTAKLPNPMAGLIPTNPKLNGSTITREQLLLPYPQYTSISLSGIPIGKSRYDSVNFKVTKRMSRGLSFLAAYSIMKNLEQVNLLNAQDYVFNDPEASPLEKRSAVNIDTPQKFVIAGLYELPFGRGRQFGANWRPALNHVLGGWQLNWNVTYQIGFTISYPNAAQVRPGSAKLSPDERRIERWFDTSLWENPATGKMVPRQEPYTLRTFPTQFSDVRLPAYHNWDVSITKGFPLREQLTLKFRAEFINAFNHPWFTGIASVDVASASFGQLNPTQGNLPRNIKLALTLDW